MAPIPTNISEHVGRTPMVQLARMAPDGVGIFGKLEAANPGGSVKDRIGVAMIEAAERDGLIEPGRTTIVEATSGNTGIALAFVCAAKGYDLVLFLPQGMSREREGLLRLYGARVEVIESLGGMNEAIDAARERASGPDAFLPDQFSNPANPEVHRRTTGPEILEAMDGAIDVLVAGVGTGGTITGVGEFLKGALPDVRIVAVEPASSAVLSGRPAGPHKIQGIGAGFVPAVLNRDVIDEVIPVGDEAAIDTARAAARTEGVLCGHLVRRRAVGRAGDRAAPGRGGAADRGDPARLGRALRLDALLRALARGDRPVVQAPGLDRGPRAVARLRVDVAGPVEHVDRQAQRPREAALVAGRAVRVPVGADDARLARRARDRGRVQRRRVELAHAGDRGHRARRRDQQDAVDRPGGRRGRRLARPQQAGERVADDRPLALHRVQLGAHRRGPLGGERPVGLGEARIAHRDLRGGEPLGQPGLPVIGSRALPAMQDEERAHRATVCPCSASERRLAWPVSCAATSGSSTSATRPRGASPARRSWARWPGVHALLSHRVAHALHEAGVPVVPRAIAYAARAVTGIEIHPGATVGDGFFIDHGHGVVIGETAEIGDDVTLYQGVTLGGTGFATGKRHPTVEDNVTIGSGAKLLGPITDRPRRQDRRQHAS